MVKTFLAYCKKQNILFPNVFIGKITIIIVVALIIIFASLIIGFNNTIENDIYKKTIHQPINVFSSIVYLLVAIIILGENFKKINYKSNVLNKENLIHKTVFALVLLYIFIASSLYHSLLTKSSLKMDYSAVYFFSLFPVMYFNYQWLITNPNFTKQKSIFLIYIIYLGTCICLSIYAPIGKEELVTFACIVLFFAFVAYFFKQKRTDFKYVFLSVGCIIVGLFWFELDKYLAVNYPNNSFRTHSLWNLFIGFSGFYFYIFIRNQDYEDKNGK